MRPERCWPLAVGVLWWTGTPRRRCGRIATAAANDGAGANNTSIAAAGVSTSILSRAGVNSFAIMRARGSPVARTVALASIGRMTSFLKFTASFSMAANAAGSSAKTGACPALTIEI